MDRFWTEVHYKTPRAAWGLGGGLSRRYNWEAMNYDERIVRDPRVAGGEPIVKGTGVTLRTVLASLAERGKRD